MALACGMMVGGWRGARWLWAVVGARALAVGWRPAHGMMVALAGGRRLAAPDHGGAALATLHGGKLANGR